MKPDRFLCFMCFSFFQFDCAQSSKRQVELSFELLDRKKVQKSKDCSIREVLKNNLQHPSPCPLAKPVFFQYAQPNKGRDAIMAKFSVKFIITCSAWAEESRIWSVLALYAKPWNSLPKPLHPWVQIQSNY